jgi:succinate-semialdehyde dehydrogenase/glutarate-semialdehyde dehydrogenase
MYINGEWRNALSKKSFESINPATGEVIDAVPDGNAEDAKLAIDAANNAFPSWAGKTAYERSAILYKAWQLMGERKGELARLMTIEQGKPLRAAANETQYAADFLLWYAEEAKRVYGETIPSARGDQRFIISKAPVGVVAAITPWNYPISMLTRKLGPALAAGCTVVLKPAEATPLCAIAVYKILEEAGVPPGVINLVTAKDPKPIGDVFTSDPRIAKITFTGSTAVGRTLAKEAGHNLKRISMELGGHAPFIVWEDADPTHAAKGASLVKFLNTGQACISPNRMFVHENQAEAYVAELTSRVERLRAGNGLDDGIGIGPLVNEAAVAKVERQVEDARSKGAKVMCGGHRLMESGLDKGHFYAATVLTDVTPDMLIYSEETFGPVAAVVPFRDGDDVLAMANDTPYGLAAYVYTNDIAKAMRTVEGLNFAIIGVNDINPTSAAAPFGGMKSSGLGREGGHEGIEEYLESKTAGFSI